MNDDNFQKQVTSVLGLRTYGRLLNEANSDSLDASCIRGASSPWWLRIPFWTKMRIAMSLSFNPISFPNARVDSSADCRRSSVGVQ